MRCEPVDEKVPIHFPVVVTSVCLRRETERSRPQNLWQCHLLPPQTALLRQAAPNGYRSHSLQLVLCPPTPCCVTSVWWTTFHPRTPPVFLPVGNTWVIEELQCSDIWYQGFFSYIHFSLWYFIPEPHTVQNTPYRRLCGFTGNNISLP